MRLQSLITADSLSLAWDALLVFGWVSGAVLSNRCSGLSQAKRPWAILFVPMLLGLAWLRPKKDFELPGVIEHLVAACGGMATAFLLLLAFTQAQVMHPLAPERIPNTLLAVRPLLSALGQKRVAPTAPPTGTPADKPTQALVAPGLR